MTKKRFHKLLRSEMSKLMSGNPGVAGICIRAAANASLNQTISSYYDMWQQFRPVFTYRDNVPPVK